MICPAGCFVAARVTNFACARGEAELVGRIRRRNPRALSLRGTLATKQSSFLSCKESWIASLRSNANSQLSNLIRSPAIGIRGYLRTWKQSGGSVCCSGNGRKGSAAAGSADREQRSASHDGTYAGEQLFVQFGRRIPNDVVVLPGIEVKIVNRS